MVTIAQGHLRTLTRKMVHAEAGFDVVKQGLQAKANLGYVPDRPYLYPKLTGRELLRFFYFRFFYGKVF